MKAIYWVIGVAVVGITLFIYVLLGDMQKTVPKIKLSYFKDEQEIAQSINKILYPEIVKNSSFWVGVEPEKPEQLQVILQLKEDLEKIKPFTTVILDSELKLSKEWTEKLKAVEVVSIKENLQAAADLLIKLEKNNENYFLITANIYSNSMIKKNQIHQIKELQPIRPMTFSFAYFPIKTELEKNMLFSCDTEDHAGISDWSCAVANKARFSRRRIDANNPKAWIGLMDLIGEKDYMILLYKK